MNDTPSRLDLRTPAGGVVERKGLVAEVTGVRAAPSVVQSPIAHKRSAMEGLTHNEMQSAQGIIKVIEIWLADHADDLKRAREGQIQIKVGGWKGETIQWFALQGLTVSVSPDETIVGFADTLELWVSEKKALIAKQVGTIK